ncbi:MAG: hypothetical protein ABJN34_06030 [Litoreibacter sp.]|uniref:hypothetical protein n=1 Tax=Litoreibacter sp. TaxID=1969459 RepID=UPI003299D2FF
MRQAIDFFSYGVTQLFTNFGAALRLTGLIWIAAKLIIVALGLIMIGTADTATGLAPDAEGEIPGLAATFTVMSFLITFLATAWISLMWHRFCLGADTPQGAVPSLKGLPFTNYLFSLLLLVVVMAGAGLILGFAERALQPVLPFTAALALPLVIIFIILWLFLRLATILPATAAGQVLSIKQAWSGSRGKSIWLLTVLAFIMAIILTLPTILIPSLPILKVIISFVTSWLAVLIGTGWLVAIFRTIPLERK